MQAYSRIPDMLVFFFFLYALQSVCALHSPFAVHSTVVASCCHGWGAQVYSQINCRANSVSLHAWLVQFKADRQTDRRSACFCAPAAKAGRKKPIDSTYPLPVSNSRGETCRPAVIIRSGVCVRVCVSFVRVPATCCFHMHSVSSAHVAAHCV